jgi:hypothetical protein
MCGMKSCSDILQSMVIKLGWQAVGFLALIAIICPNILVLMHRCIMGRNTAQKEGVIQTYHNKYGISTEYPYYESMEPYECSTLQEKTPYYKNSISSVEIDMKSNAGMNLNRRIPCSDFIQA